jgi:uncharacterized protein (TIGR03663 family)
MNPQPPVTNMRIDALTNSAPADALAVFPTWEERWADLKQRAAAIDWFPVGILALAAFLRFLLLGMKPPHFDEGINGWFVDQMMKTGFYRYDPSNYHGPLHFYVLYVSEALFGRNIWSLRLPVVCVSMVCVYLMMKFEPFVGRNISRIGAICMAVSGGFVFYGRYSIHEVWLLMFSMLFILGLLGLWRRGTRGYLWCLGVGCAGMILTKETYVIHVGCAVIAIFVTWVTHLIDKVPGNKPAKQSWSYLDLSMVVLVAIVAILFFYSGTFFNPEGIKGLYTTFEAWARTGSKGNGHEKVWYYWFQIMFKSCEVPVFVGLAFSPWVVLRVKNISLRYLAIYSVGAWAAYSIVHYKTPWCLIVFVWPLYFVFASILLVTPVRYRLGTYICLGLCIWASLCYSVYLNYFKCSSDSEPYVYVQTYNDIFKLTDPVLTLARKDPSKYQMIGHLIRSSTYPLPWVLADFTKVGYYESGNIPDKVDADFLLVQQDKIADVEKKLTGAYFTEPLVLRQYQDPSKLFLSAQTFQSLFPGRAPDFTGKPAKP